MNESEIKRALINSRSFIGTFPSDRLPKLALKKKKCLSLIVNTDPANEPGEHWTAIYLCKRKVEYFDSYGLPPLDERVQRFLDYHSMDRGWAFCATQTQYIQSQMCGLFCIQFIKSRDSGKSYKKFAQKFSIDLKQNDRILKRLDSIKYKPSKHNH